MHQPQVSVVIPVYNGARDVAKAIDSILTQTFSDFELIVVNDGSTDDTASVLRTFTDPRFRVIEQKKSGAAQAANSGIAVARGKYVARLDHDDRSRPERLAKQVAFLESNPDHAVVGTWAEIWAGDTPTRRFHEHPVNDAALRFESLFGNFFVHSSLMMRKSAVEDVGNYNTDIRCNAEDYDLLSRLIRRFRAANLPERLTIYREIDASRSRDTKNPIENSVILTASQNIAVALCEPSVRDVHRDIAALMNGAYEKVSPAAELDEMCELIRVAGAAIIAEAPTSDVITRVAARIDGLQHHFHNARSKPHISTSIVTAPPLVSVVMPIFNGAIDAPRAIRSILTQTYRDFELIAINDGSSDATASVLNANVDPRMRIVHQGNIGLARTLNRGIELARGRYIARMDHDDIAKPTRLEKQVAYLESDSHCALVGTRAKIWIGNRPTGRAHDHPIDDAALRFELLFDNYFVHSSVMLRKSALEAIGGYTTDPERPPPEDYELWSRLAHHHRLANLPEYLTIYREVLGSISRTKALAILNGVVQISAENLAAAVGESTTRNIHRDITALIHGAYHLVSPAPDLEAMCRLVDEAASRITAGVPESDVSIRAQARIHSLSQNYRAFIVRRQRPKIFKLWRRNIRHFIANLIRPT